MRFKLDDLSYSQKKRAAALSHLLKALDFALTGKLPDDYDPERSLWDWITGELFYLSDGGYSRVGYSFDAQALFLTDNSIDPARSNWARLTHLRRMIEKLMREIIAKEGD